MDIIFCDSMRGATYASNSANKIGIMLNACLLLGEATYRSFADKQYFCQMTHNQIASQILFLVHVVIIVGANSSG